MNISTLLRRRTDPSAEFAASRSSVATRYTLDCRIESGVHLYYEILPEGGVVHISEPQEDTVLVSAVYAPPGRADDDTAEDYRFHLPKRMSASQASSYLQRELGLYRKLRSVIQGGAGIAVWACSEEKVLSRQKVMPFAWALERLMTLDNLIPPCVTGVLFGESDLLILMAFPGNGRVFVQTSVAPDNLAEIIAAFAAINSINVDINTMPIYTGGEFLVALLETPGYPLDTDLAGIPVPALAQGATVLSAVVLTLSAGVGVYCMHATQLLARQTRDIAAQRVRTESAILDRLQSNPPAMGQAMAVDYPSLLDHATRLWVEGARVESEASAVSETHTLILPLQDKKRITDRAQIDAALRPVALPPSCHMSGYSLSGSGNELYARYECVRIAGPLAMMEQGNEIP